MKTTKVIYTILILVVVTTGTFLYVKYKNYSNDMEILKNNEKLINSDLEKTISNINSLIISIPGKKSEIEKLNKELEETKKNFDWTKLKPISGYTVTTYTTRNGNHTNRRNYIKYR